MTNVTKVILKYRKLKGLSQWYLAKHLGYDSPQFISNIERGLCEIPISKLRQVCFLLTIPHGIMIRAYVADASKEINEALATLS